MIQGITIILVEQVQTGVDDFNCAVYEDRPVEVDNVLVAPASSAEILDVLNLTGRKAVYTLAIQKGDAHSWEGCKVILPEPFAGTYQVIQIPLAGIESMIPLAWNKKIIVEKYGRTEN